MRIAIENARLSFPSLFKTALYEGEDTGRYGCTILIPKEDKATVAKVKQAMTALVKDNKIPKLPPDRKCVRNGDDFPQYGWEGYIAIKATTSVRPHIVNRDMSPIAQEDNIIYSGCRINANVELWYQVNYGKRINATLNGIQFVGDDEPFGAAPVAADDIFGRMDAEQEDENRSESDSSQSEEQSESDDLF